MNTPPSAGELRALAHQLMVWADHLADRPERDVEDAEPGPRLSSIALIEAMRGTRRLRAEIFPISAFANPAWDVFLDLALRELNGFGTSLHEVALGEGNLAPLVRQCIDALIEADLVYKTEGDGPEGVTWLLLTPNGLRKMQEYLDGIAELVQPQPRRQPQPDTGPRAA